MPISAVRLREEKLAVRDGRVQKRPRGVHALAPTGRIGRIGHSVGHRIVKRAHTRAVARLRGVQLQRFLHLAFAGTPEAGLRRIVDGQLAPSVLARSALCERALEAAGCRQYVLFAAGYDTFAIWNPDTPLAVFELDLPELLRDKRQRIARAGLRSCAVDVPCDLAAPAGVAYLLAVRE